MKNKNACATLAGSTQSTGCGALVTTYYFNTKDDPIQYEGGVRHIAASIWQI